MLGVESRVCGVLLLRCVVKRIGELEWPEYILCIYWGVLLGIVTAVPSRISAKRGLEVIE